MLIKTVKQDDRFLSLSKQRFSTLPFVIKHLPKQHKANLTNLCVNVTVSSTLAFINLSNPSVQLRLSVQALQC